MRQPWVYRNNSHARPDVEGTVHFPARQPRLDRLPNWELISSPEDAPSIETSGTVMPAAWSDPPAGDDQKRSAPPEPDPVGAQLIVVTRPAGGRRKGSPAPTIKGTPLDPGKGTR